MSPACIASFSGDNGGATSSGVTPTRVEVVLYNDMGISGDLTASWSQTDEVPGHQSDPTGATTYLVRTAKALVSHFNSRYQTFSRVVRVIAYPSSLGETPDCAFRQSDVLHAIATYQPFAVATVGAVHGCVFEATSQTGVVGLGYAKFARNENVAAPRHAYTFAPTIQQITDASSSFICKALSGKPARFAGGTLQGANRRIGMIYQSTDQWMSDAAVALSVSVGSKCGLVFSPFRSYRRGAPNDLVSAVLSASQPTGPGTTGATTLICLCPASTKDAHAAVTAARSIGYQPEWLWLPEARMDRATELRGLGDPLGSHFGISSSWMAPETESQQAVRAVRDADANFDPNPVATTDLFVALRMLFTSIQLAGPTLNPTTVQSGMRSYTPSSSTGESVPGAFSISKPNSWTDTFVAWSFDGVSAPPGSVSARGCLRLFRNGQRFSSSNWPTNDATLFSGTCSGDLYRQPLDTPVSYATAYIGGI